MKYILISAVIGKEVFTAESDEDAEKFVKDNYHEDDGPMDLYRLEYIQSWLGELK